MNILRTGAILLLFALQYGIASAQCSSTTITDNLLINGGIDDPVGAEWNFFNAAYPTDPNVQFPSHQNTIASVMTEGQFFAGVSGFFQDVPLGAGETVTIGMWISQSGCAPLVGNDIALPSLEFFDASGTQISFVQAGSLTSADPTDMFMLYTVTAVTPPGTTTVRIVGLHVHNDSGTNMITSGVNFDDMFMVLGDGSTNIVETPETIPPAISCGELSSTNLVSSNATFDADISDWIPFTEFNTGFNVGWEAAESAAFIFGGFTYPIANIASIIYGSPAPATAGQSFQACMDLTNPDSNPISGNSNLAWVQLQFLDGGGNIVGTFDSDIIGKGSPTGTETFCVKGEAPVGTASVTLAGMFDQNGCGSGVIFYDNAVLNAVEPFEMITMELAPGECSMSLTEADLPMPCALDNCGIASLTSDIAILSPLPAGINTVTWTAEDMNGNISTCTVEVEILEFQSASTALACNDHINVSVDENCEVIIDADYVLEGDNYACYDNFIVEVSTLGGQVVPQPLIYDPTYGPNNEYQYTITDPSTGNSCWGTISLEDKIAPALECDCPPGSVTVNPDGSFTGPARCIIECHDVERYLDGRRGSPDIVDNCDTETEASFSGAQIEDLEDCTYKITQVWSVSTTVYPSGDTETVSCINEIYVESPSLDDVECPDDVEYECDEVDSPDLTHPDETGYPTLWNQDIKTGNIDSYCSVFATWDDVEIPACGPDCYGTTKLLRTWTILDWCTGEILTCTQVIKIVDSTDPTIIADDIVVSTDAWVCSADIWFDEPLIHDNCTYDLDYEIAWTNSGALLVDDDGRPITQNNHGLIQHAMGVPKGTWSFILKANDCCGNIGYDTISVTVIDNVAPVAVATQNIIVSLTGVYPDASAKVFCESVNNGSHDNCSGVWCELRRDSDPCGIDGNDTYSNKIPEFCDPWYDDDDHDYGQHVKFCCEDAMADGDGDGEVDGMVKVWMRVWDDANMDGIHGSYTFHNNPGNDHDYCEFNDNYNETWVYVTVEDKAPQTLICPPDITIPCHWDYTDLSVTGEAIPGASCGHPHASYVDWPEVHCGEGYVIREWFVDINNNGELDSDEGEYPCVQRITIEFVDAPLEVVCADYEGFEDITGNPDIIWFDPFNPNHVSVDCEDFEFPEPWISGAKCSLVGISETVDTFWFEQDACFKAIKTWNIVDWCTDDSYTCDFVVSLIDTEPPTVSTQDTCFAVNDYWDADNDGNYCELTSDVDVCAVGDDMGDCPSEWIKWVAKVDLWHDGNVELVYSSFIPHNDPLYVAPTPRGEKVSIELDKDDITAEWARHHIEWKAFDGCGNIAHTTQYVEVTDKKAPTPYCVGISTALMSPEAGNLVELWARDFNLGSFDNCTTEDRLKYTFGGVPPIVDELDEIHCFRPVWDDEAACVPMVDQDGIIISEEVNNCNGYENGIDNPDCMIAGIQRWNPMTNSSGIKFVGTNWCGENSIKVSVWDNKLNMDYCYVNLVVHGIECDGTLPRSISGTILTEAGDPVALAQVTNSSSLIPGGATSMMTQTDGVYAFNANLEGGDYAISSYRNNDFLNGVSTLDLVMIQKHILGITAINSAYKMVAADINNDEGITAVDLVELRKLILGIYTELPANTSWRFVDADQTLNVSNPWPIIETVNISNLTTDMMAEDFVGIKVGDVNGNAISSANSTNIDSRSDVHLDLIKESLNGSVVVKAGSNFENVYGYQFTMEVAGDITGIIPGALSVTDEHFGFLDNGQVTTSFASERALNVAEGDVLFTLVGVSEATIVSGYTQAEAYVGNELSVINVNLRDGQVGATYSLSQNEPNPFNVTTSINFNLGKAGKTTVTIYDVTGKTVKVIKGDFEVGSHQIEISKKELGSSGILYYQLDSGDFTATRKMIIIE